MVPISIGGVDTTWERGQCTLIRVLRQSPLVSYAKIAGNISRARRQRLISIISMIMVLIASISMVLIGASAMGATWFWLGSHTSRNQRVSSERLGEG